MTKVFIDGKDGTTGLKIYDRFKDRANIELLLIDDDKRKDENEIKKFINASDITFLCLPDEAARQAVTLVENDKVKILDTSTAHRTLDNWTYGFPELDDAQREKIKSASRVAVPGCHASGFISLVQPLVKAGILPKNYPVTCVSLSGYSGAGKKAINQYENEKTEDLYAPRQYALTQTHKHLPEMKKVCMLENEPIFCPIVDDYFCGMEVSVPIYTSMLNKKMGVDELLEVYKKHYGNSPIIKVKENTDSFLPANEFAGKDIMEITVTGNAERIMLVSRFDNLGKGASGAAVQCMNIMLGLDETTGLNI